MSAEEIEDMDASDREQMIREELADDARHADQVPVKCVVLGHEGQGHCRRCGDPIYNDLNRELINIARQHGN